MQPYSTVLDTLQNCFPWTKPLTKLNNWNKKSDHSVSGLWSDRKLASVRVGHFCYKKRRLKILFSKPRKIIVKIILVKIIFFQKSQYTVMQQSVKFSIFSLHAENSRQVVFMVMKQRLYKNAAWFNRAVRNDKTPER